MNGVLTITEEFTRVLAQVLSALDELVPVTTLWGVYYYYLHLTK